MGHICHLYLIVAYHLSMTAAGFKVCGEGFSFHSICEDSIVQL